MNVVVAPSTLQGGGILPAEVYVAQSTEGSKKVVEFNGDRGRESLVSLVPSLPVVSQQETPKTVVMSSSEHPQQPEHAQGSPLHRSEEEPTVLLSAKEETSHHPTLVHSIPNRATSIQQERTPASSGASDYLRQHREGGEQQQQDVGGGLMRAGGGGEEERMSICMMETAASKGEPSRTAATTGSRTSEACSPAPPCIRSTGCIEAGTGNGMVVNKDGLTLVIKPQQGGAFSHHASSSSSTTATATAAGSSLPNQTSEGGGGGGGASGEGCVSGSSGGRMSSTYANPLPCGSGVESAGGTPAASSPSSGLPSRICSIESTSDGASGAGGRGRGEEEEAEVDAELSARAEAAVDIAVAAGAVTLAGRGGGSGRSSSRASTVSSNAMMTGGKAVPATANPAAGGAAQLSNTTNGLPTQEGGLAGSSSSSASPYNSATQNMRTSAGGHGGSGAGGEQHRLKRGASGTANANNLPSSSGTSGASAAAAGAGGGGGASGGGGGSSSSSSRKKASSAAPTPNDAWKEILKFVEVYLDVESMLLLKQCARLFYRHKYRPYEGILRFTAFRGYDPKVLMESILPLACRSIHPSIRERGLSLDFSHCTLIKDVSVARLMDAVHGEKEENQILGNLKSLCLDFGYEITDKGLCAMLTTYLPHLETVSLRCARSTELTFLSVIKHLSSDRWPKLISFDASFTNIWLEAATAIADCLFMNAARMTAYQREQQEAEEKLRKQKQHEQEQEREEHEQRQQQRQLLRLQAQQLPHQASGQLGEGGGGGSDDDRLHRKESLHGASPAQGVFPSLSSPQANQPTGSSSGGGEGGAGAGGSREYSATDACSQDIAFAGVGGGGGPSEGHNDMATSTHSHVSPSSCDGGNSSLGDDAVVLEDGVRGGGGRGAGGAAGGVEEAPLRGDLMSLAEVPVLSCSGEEDQLRHQGDKHFQSQEEMLMTMMSPAGSPLTTSPGGPGGSASHGSSGNSSSSSHRTEGGEAVVEGGRDEKMEEAEDRQKSYYALRQGGIAAIPTSSSTLAPQTASSNLEREVADNREPSVSSCDMEQRFGGRGGAQQEVQMRTRSPRSSVTQVFMAGGEAWGGGHANTTAPPGPAGAGGVLSPSSGGEEGGEVAQATSSHQHEQGASSHEDPRTGGGSQSVSQYAGDSTSGSTTTAPASTTTTASSSSSDFFVKPSLEIIGSVASKSLLLKVGMEGHYRSFREAVKSGDWQTVSAVTKRIQKELSELAATAPYNSSRLILLQQFRGSELLVNCPLTVETTEEGGVNVLTLPISIAIQKEDTDTLNVLLKRGAEIEVCDYLGKSPLYRACEVGRRDIVETLLLQYRASPEAADVRSDLFPLHTAVKKKDVEVVKLLLKRGASLDLKCPAVKSYKSALFVACEVNAPEIVQLLLEAGADPNWKGHNTYTPTLLAYQLNSAWLPHFLDAGAGSSKNKRWVLTEVLSCAIAKNDLVSVEVLVRKYPDLLTRDHQLWSKPLIQAAKQGKADIISALLASGSPVDVKKKEGGQTPLLAAAEEDFVVCVQLLLDAGADINKTNNAGLTALHLACTENRTEVVKLLLNRGCDVNVGDKANGEAPLMMCIRMRNEKMASLILDLAKNLDVEKKDMQGSTALLYAMFFGQYAVAGRLMDRGADVTVSDHAGNSAYSVVNERLMTQGADKRVLKKFLRLYKNSKEGRRSRHSQAATAAAATTTTSSDAVTGEDSAASGADSGTDGGGGGNGAGRRHQPSAHIAPMLKRSLGGGGGGTCGSSSNGSPGTEGFPTASSTGGGGGSGGGASSSGSGANANGVLGGGGGSSSSSSMEVMSCTSSSSSSSSSSRSRRRAQILSAGIRTPPPGTAVAGGGGGGLTNGGACTTCSSSSSSSDTTSLHSDPASRTDGGEGSSVSPERFVSAPPLMKKTTGAGKRDGEEVVGEGMMMEVDEDPTHHQQTGEGGGQQQSQQQGSAAGGGGRVTAGRSKSSGTNGKKLKIEPKTVLQVAKLPITLFRAAKAK